MTVIEGEVLLQDEVVVDTSRRRERNEVRANRSSVEVLPPDVQTKVSALSTLDGQAQATAVTAMLSHSRTGLLAAIAAQDLPQIVEWKAKGAAIQEVAKQLRLGKDMQQDATEFVRRAERGLGVAIRDGQSRGTVETPREASARGSAARDGLLDKHDVKPKPTDFAKSFELSGNRTHGDPGIYGMTDGVSDEAFEEALEEARSEGSISRANVSRKCQAKANPTPPRSEQSASDPPKPKPKPVGNLDKFIENLVVSINSLVFIVDDTDPTDVDYQRHKGDLEEIWKGTNVIRRFVKLVEAGA